MRSEHIEQADTPTHNVSEALSNIIDVATYQRKIERRNILISVISVAAIIMTIFLIDALDIMGFLMVCLPVIFIAVGVILLVVSWKRYKQKLSYSLTLILGVLALLFPIMLCILLAFAFVLGGPVPQ